MFLQTYRSITKPSNNSLILNSLNKLLVLGKNPTSQKMHCKRFLSSQIDNNYFKDLNV